MTSGGAASRHVLVHCHCGAAGSGAGQFMFIDPWQCGNQFMFINDARADQLREGHAHSDKFWERERKELGLWRLLAKIEKVDATVAEPQQAQTEDAIVIDWREKRTRKGVVVSKRSWSCCLSGHTA
eukprot:CAMPEP_0202836812 /NCGR_PEP_ID=MMETSP1389-20130828/43369_1 /ASSEMBLY_ACC=CAM_ASM_000865 /TAXON_ID=302021 /ORGANISM="Rhodomonas sp., Strain CCMP768" /LENGTH=125 /DNA_ID=CAMNT_0049512733 /DNA_START=26 /DNA_END=400 /DNA_ORIENTATION=-